MPRPGGPGPPGNGTSWGTLSFSFAIGGRATGVTVTGFTCTLVGHGAYACRVTVASTANFSQRVGGLEYVPNPSVYYAGANPTLGWILVPANGSSTFTLWFQEVATSRASDVTVTLFVTPWPRAPVG